MFLELVYFAIKICIGGNKIRLQAIHHLQYHVNVHFLLLLLEMKNSHILNIVALLLF